jgi:hypothetical protein
MKSNILSVYNKAYPAQHEIGMNWYAKAHRLARDMSIKHKLKSYRYAAGILSVLSPATTWERNIIDANVVCATKNEENIVVTTYGQFLAKALAIKNGRDPDTVISKVTGKKTWAFYQCISKPMNNLHVVVDRHALAIPLGALERGQMLKRVGMYQKISDAYKEAAAEVGILPLQMQAVCWVTYRDNL